MNPTGKIGRNLKAATGQPHDLIIIGGGAYGALLALESTRHGLRPLIVERDDFGGSTTWNTTRFVHGGLRYLQTCDLARSLESIRERRWFFRCFPEHMAPLPCLLPLYQHDLKGPGFFRLAMGANDLISCRRNVGVRSERRLRNGSVLNTQETLARFPLAKRDGLRGGVLWHDGFMTHPQRILIETIRWACALGATALNYVEMTGLIGDKKQVRGVEAVDCETGRSLRFTAPVVVNCAGAQVRALATQLDRDRPTLMQPVLLINLLLDLPPLAPLGIGVRPPGEQGVHFLLPLGGRTLAGTYHVRVRAGEAAKATQEHVDAFLTSLNNAAPGLNLKSTQVLRVFAGWLPATDEGELEIAHRPIVIDHGSTGGPAGFHSVSGIKWTTARPVLEKLVKRLFPAATRLKADACPDRKTFPTIDFFDPSHALAHQPEFIRRQVRIMANDEAALHLDDIFLRRTDWGLNPRIAAANADSLSRLMDWDEVRRVAELRRLEQALEQSLPDRPWAGSDSMRKHGKPDRVPSQALDSTECAH